MEEVATEFFGAQVSNWRFFDLCHDLDRASAAQKEWPRERLLNATSALGHAVTAYFNSVAALSPSEVPRFTPGLRAAEAALPKRAAQPGLFERRNAEPPRDAVISDAEVMAEPESSRLHDSRWGVAATPAGRWRRPRWSPLPRSRRSSRGDSTGWSRRSRKQPDRLPSAEVDGFRRRCSENRVALQTFDKLDDASRVYWAETRGKGVFLRAAPVDVAETLRARLFAEQRPVVMTSATLATGGDTIFFRRRIGLSSDEGDVRPTAEVVLSSPFDFERQAAIYVPRHLPDPADEGYLSPAAEEIAALVALAKGRSSFFTRYRARTRFTAGRPRDPVPGASAGTETEGRSHSRLPPGPRPLRHAVLLEGVDIQGDALLMVIIDKLPFASPGDPLVAARMRAIAERGGSSFHEYQLPAAAITLSRDSAASSARVPTREQWRFWTGASGPRDTAGSFGARCHPVRPLSALRT